MRVRITAVVAFLVASALTGAGLIVYLIETQRLEEQTVREVDQEMAEFTTLEAGGIDPTTGESFTDVRPLLRTFLERNVPDDDELFVGWLGDGPVVFFPPDMLVEDPAFLEATRPLISRAGSTRLDTAEGEVLITIETVRGMGYRFKT